MLSSLEQSILNKIQKSRNVSLEEIRQHLLSIRGSSFISVITKTKPRMRKTGNAFYDRVTKISRFDGVVGFDYESGVNRRLVKEGKQADFTASSPTNGITPFFREDGTFTPLATNSHNEWYLRMQLNDNKYEPVYLLDDLPIPVDAVEPYLQRSNSYTNQGVENTLKIICPKLENIVLIAANNEVLRKV